MSLIVPSWEVHPDCLIHDRLERPFNDWAAPPLPERPVVVLCESQEEVLHAASTSDLQADALVALTPQAAYECRMLEIPFYKIEDFFDITAFSVGDEPMLSLQSRWSDAIDSFGRDRVPEFEELGFRPAGNYFYFLKVVIDMLFRASFGLAHLFSSCRDPYVISYNADTPGGLDDTLFFKESVYKLILPSCAQEYGVELTVLPACEKGSGRDDYPAVRRRASFGGFAMGVLKRTLPAAMTRHLQEIRKQGLRNWFLTKPPSKGSPEIVCQGPYDVDPVMDLAQKKGLSVRPLAEVIASLPAQGSLAEDLRGRLTNVWLELKCQPFFTEPFRWLGIDLFPAAETRLYHWWQRIVPAMWETLIQARESFQARRPDVLFMAISSRPEDLGALQAARSLGIPTVTFQHGGFIGNCEYTILDMTDLRHADYRFVYGNGTLSYHRERQNRWQEKRAEVLAVGSPRLDALQRAATKQNKVRRQLGIKPSQRLIFYLPTSYQPDWYMAREAYFGVPYFELLTKVIKVFGEFSRHRFVYKPFPERPMDPVAALARELPNCLVVTDISVPELAQASDAIIVDLPSTGLLEALLTSKPMLVLSDARFVTLRPEARELLCKRAGLAETPEEFFRQLRLFLSRDEFTELERPDRSFLRSYGTHLDDGRSAERAFEALRKIMNGDLGTSPTGPVGTW